MIKLGNLGITELKKKKKSFIVIVKDEERKKLNGKGKCLFPENRGFAFYHPSHHLLGR